MSKKTKIARPITPKKGKLKAVSLTLNGVLLTIFIVFLVHINDIKQENRALRGQLKSLLSKQETAGFLKFKDDISCENQARTDIAPSCPTGVGKIILPRFFPTHTIYLGYQGDLLASSTSRALINRALSASPPIKVVILTPNDLYDVAVKEISSFIGNHQKYLIEIIPTPSDFTVWTQDYFETATNLTTGSFSFIDLPYKKASGEHIPTTLSLACNANLIGQSEIEAENQENGAANFGGNIEALTKDLIVIGNNMHPSQKERLRQELSQHIVEIDVSWLYVGHVDELISIIPKKDHQGSCPFDIIYASPQLGLDLLERKSRESKGLDIELGKQDDRFLLSDCFLKKDNPPENCDLIIAANQAYDRIVESNIKILKKSLQKRSQCHDVKFVKIPNIFTAKQKQQRYGTSKDLAISLTPNPINNVLIDDFLFLPQQSFAVFHDYTKKILSQFKLQFEFVDSSYVHRYRGGIHCSFNSRKACRPQE